MYKTGLILLKSAMKITQDVTRVVLTTVFDPRFTYNKMAANDTVFHIIINHYYHLSAKEQMWSYS